MQIRTLPAMQRCSHKQIEGTPLATHAISTTETKVIPAEKATKREVEQTLLRRAQRGEEEAFGTLFQLHKNRVYSICLVMTKDVAEAEDLTQETFLQVFRNVGGFRGDSAFSTWLHRVAVNTVLMNIRRRKSPPTVSLDEPVSAEQPSLRRDFGSSDPNLSGAIDRMTLHRALLELPPGSRKIFGLHAVHGYQHHEIAQLLHCSIGNSKSQLHKAKMKMRKLLLPPAITARRQTAASMRGERGVIAAANNLCSESTRPMSAT